MRKKTQGESTNVVQIVEVYCNTVFDIIIFVLYTAATCWKL
jgi:hypothetical protein